VATDVATAGGVWPIVANGSSAAGGVDSSIGTGLASCSAPCVVLAACAVLTMSATSLISGLSSTSTASPRPFPCRTGASSSFGWGPSVRLLKKTSLCDVFCGVGADWAEGASVAPAGDGLLLERGSSPRRLGNPESPSPALCRLWRRCTSGRIRISTGDKRVLRRASR